ncbi:MAG: Ig domain-containing protein [Spirochaetales bacterium]|nr:Ig domain-containing protein [Spirochaetales bacterium]
MKKSTLILFVLIAVFAAVTFVACNPDGIPVRSVTLNIDSTFMKTGEAKTLYATVRPADAADTSVSWTSSDEGVATVDQNGKVTAVATGKAVITVTSNFDNTKKASCTVNVYDPYSTPLTLELIEAGDFTISLSKFSGPKVYYSFNGGERKEITGLSVKFENCSAGDKIELYRDVTPLLPSCSIGCSSDCYVYGNVMSMVDSDDFETLDEVPEKAFQALFKGNEHIQNHPDYGLVLPATTLADYCYESMFYRCSGLTKAPELPAKTLAGYCYSSMFSYCSSLIKAPELPATTLADHCNYRMFEYCTGLTESPVLSAKILVDYCYEEMFEGCENITSITCLATDVSAEGCTDYWVYGLHDQGTFYKDPSMDWDTGYSKVPAGWEIKDYPTK